MLAGVGVKESMKAEAEKWISVHVAESVAGD